jgi:chemotaxis family two-component system sensor kinase Cph1
MNEVSPPVTLENCDREPIHIPGQIQSHGAMLVFDLQGIATHVSANARALLGPAVPALGEVLAPHHFDGDATVHDTIASLLVPANSSHHDELTDGLPLNADVRLNGAGFDLIVHRAAGRVVVELECQPIGEDALTGFAIKAHRAIDKLKRQPSISALLDVAVRSVRQLTGFDRVMAYRFRHDDSGEVVAEEHVATLEPFLGRRYPASDIPSQARRLYVVNTLRLIADVNSTPIALTALNAISDAEPALDMSHCVLRAVSPIHIEYLRNMGVEASMSISIVVNGSLWGMLACHHMSMLQVPYSVRMACDVLAQIVAANVQSLLAREQAQQLAQASTLRNRIIEAALHADDTLAALVQLAPSLCEAFNAQAMVLAEDGKLFTHGDLSKDVAGQLARWLEAPGAVREAMIGSSSLEDLPAELTGVMGAWCGLLALRYDDNAPGWLVLLRKEQIENIDWGGNPEKEYTSGPLGPRLTPRGSFDVWKQTVRGMSVPWSMTELELGRQLCGELMRAGAARMAEVSRARSHLLAMLGHDLRDPLQSISMAARVLEKGGVGTTDASAASTRLGQRIQSSSGRMARLIGQVLDISRLESGFGLQLNFAEVDLTRLLDDMLDEANIAHPGTVVIREAPESLMAEVDADRISQVFSNLVSNARHHGAIGEAIAVALTCEEGVVQLVVRNVAPPIAEEQLPHLFAAFMRQSGANARNKGGLGLGLHIARAIVTGHGGDIAYKYVAPHVNFTARFPIRRN